MIKIEVSCDRCRAVISADRTKIETGPFRTFQGLQQEPEKN
jgi:hypothetical protein